MLLFFKIMMAEFIAEMGDKTQLMLIAMTSKYKMRHIIIGTAVAVMVLNALAVLAGGLVGSLIPEWLIKIIAAGAFLFFAATSVGGKDDDEDEKIRDSKTKYAYLAVFATFFIAELGDKTQLTAITFGANEGLSNAVIVWAACSAGLFAADIIGMLIGYFLKSRTPDGFLNALAFVIFAIFGIVTLRTGLNMLLGAGNPKVLYALLAVTLIFAAVCAVRIYKSLDHSKVIINGKVHSIHHFDPAKDTSDDYIYEVIRIIDGKPVFPEEHHARLARSLELIGQPINFTEKEMCEDIGRLIAANNVTNDNVKLIIDGFAGHGIYSTYYMLLHASYPSAEDYRDGVPTEFYEAVRENPHVKIRNQDLRDRTNQIIHDHQLFEVILVDNDGNITEGSRSNIFFIKDGIVYTSPAEGVLLGVTSQKIIQLCQKVGITVSEEAIPRHEAEKADAAFISGTSPKVLPICRIGDVRLDVDDHTLRLIMALFDKEMY